MHPLHLFLFVLTTVTAVGAIPPNLPGEYEYTVPAAFPTSVFASYHVLPGSTTEPQPVIFDPVLNITFPFNLTDPEHIPKQNTDTPVYPPAPGEPSDKLERDEVINRAIAEVKQLIFNSSLPNNCTKCTAILAVGQKVARTAPSALPGAMGVFCSFFKYISGKPPGGKSCDTYSVGISGGPWTQILATANMTGRDGQNICAYLNHCDAPPAHTVKAKFPKPYPKHPKTPISSGKKVKVLHLSDLHLDTRYSAGSEANCAETSGRICCRLRTPEPPKGKNSTAIPQTPIPQFPAPIYGAHKCDSPYYLALAALQSIGPLSGATLENPPAFTLYTGDLIAHDAQHEKSRDYVESIESVVWQMFKYYIGGPLYAALGNHDTSPDNHDVAHAVDNNGPLGKQFSWNYDHVSKLWEHYGWIDSKTQEQAAAYYAAYSVVHPLGLRIITLNTDLSFKGNPFAYIHSEDPDFSGMFAFLIEELQKAEDAGQRVWIMGHAHGGWDGWNGLFAGSDLLQQIIERYSPHVIANAFWGHTHEDQTVIYYKNNGTSQTASNALVTGWIGPSISPHEDLNSGWRMYEVDTGSWDIMEAYTFFANVSTFDKLNETGPVFKLEYSTRAAYADGAGWPTDTPLNATFWHLVTEAMERNHTMVDDFVNYQSKSSALGPSCRNEMPGFPSESCYRALVCYIRSSTVALGSACPPLYGTVQHNPWPAHKREIKRLKAEASKKEEESKKQKESQEPSNPVKSVKILQTWQIWDWLLGQDIALLDEWASNFKGISEKLGST
ncbi:Metallo-dependent phosphatase-like protein [Cercophora newfieldiana]|uniref:Metallo-dependent phosphatase-like protein n=1 Tax=Cercophora newfieldiana TaxID=92897 RepID=A0AA39YFV7_9PEZI|nr:Metallo-dependent phosphatase-like protein [Cercophora newfieldiana]